MRNNQPNGVTPMLSTTISRFMKVYKQLCPTAEDEVPVEVFAERLGWPLDTVRTVAEWCRDRDLIDTDAGLGDRIQIIEGRYRH